jgi:TatD DNase family protein
MWIDSHCHLDKESFPEGADAVIERAHQAGVSGLVCVGVGGPASVAGVLELARRRSDVVAAVGVHPHDAASHDVGSEQEWQRLFDDAAIAAVGEIGLDYHYDSSPRPVQREVFARFIAFARQAKKPIVVHSRSAPGDTLEILEREQAHDVGGVMHCFSEDLAFARRALDLGFYLSFSGILTFKNAHAIHEVAKYAPLDRILVETDSPYLAPVPFRGKRCEPAYVVRTGARLAELRQTPVAEVAALTSTNARRLFSEEFRAAS